mmetsp:Transcript_37289/g.95403  ORF Transcript_37289/g.95403 Transcript_37289/m.95403 type:complete len:293 (-) Transcript_37289:20-898(-)
MPVSFPRHGSVNSFTVKNLVLIVLFCSLSGYYNQYWDTWPREIKLTQSSVGTVATNAKTDSDSREPEGDKDEIGDDDMDADQHAPSQYRAFSGEEGDVGGSSHATTRRRRVSDDEEPEDDDDVKVDDAETTTQKRVDRRRRENKRRTSEEEDAPARQGRKTDERPATSRRRGGTSDTGKSVSSVAASVRSVGSRPRSADVITGRSASAPEKVELSTTSTRGLDRKRAPAATAAAGAGDWSKQEGDIEGETSRGAVTSNSGRRRNGAAQASNKSSSSPRSEVLADGPIADIRT